MEETGATIEDGYIESAPGCSGSSVPGLRGFHGKKPRGSLVRATGLLRPWAAGWLGEVRADGGGGGILPAALVVARCRRTINCICTCGWFGQIS